MKLYEVTFEAVLAVPANDENEAIITARMLLMHNAEDLIYCSSMHEKYQKIAGPAQFTPADKTEKALFIPTEAPAAISPEDQEGMDEIDDQVPF